MQCLMYHDERCFALEEAVKEASDMRLVSAGGVAACPQGLRVKPRNFKSSSCAFLSMNVQKSSGMLVLQICLLYS